MRKNQIFNPWIVIPRPNPLARLRLFCLPFAGGGSASFRSWPNILPQTIELAAIEYPGRGQRLAEPLLRHLPQLVDGISTAMEPFIDEPFAIFGHSMGALLGFELVSQLAEKYDRSPIHVFLSGRGAPTIPPREEPIHQLADEQFIEQIKKYNGTPREVLDHEELMEMMLPILRADFEVCETYQIGDAVSISAPLTVYGGLQDQGANTTELKAWSALTSGPFNLRMFPGDHFFILNNQSSLIQSITRDINNHFNISRTG